ncbi:hypothetical protein [Maricaulis sp.]|uniref:hypothetical protein n=1 Tax=Maricaulis sp. TaxID=1486257 RepID=UPI0025C01C8F|nr:hypothetical protein [Maricaulis sp.]
MIMTLLAATALALAPNAPARAEEQAFEQAETGALSLADHLAPELGRFAVANWVMSGPGEMSELHFTVETGLVLGGQGVRTIWREAGTGAFFGELTRVLDAETGEVVQHWFAAARGEWAVTRQALEFAPDGHGSEFSGEDGFGPFDARTRTRHNADGSYVWTIERRYPGTNWFLVDRGEAVPIAN